MLFVWLSVTNGPFKTKVLSTLKQKKKKTEINLWFNFFSEKLSFYSSDTHKLHMVLVWIFGIAIKDVFFIKSFTFSWEVDTVLTVNWNYVSVFTTLLRSTASLGLKPQFYKHAQLSGEPYTHASRTCLSICRVKEMEGTVFRGCFRSSDDLFWVYK